MILLILADLDNAIAKNGKQITFIPEDLARFKARTTGEVILMGRKTLENAGRLPPSHHRRHDTKESSR